MRYLLLLIAALPLFGTQSFEFKESRYYKALDIKMDSYGTATYDGNVTLIEYAKPIAKSIEITKNSAYLTSEGTKTEIEHKSATAMLRFMNMLIKNDLAGAERFFEIRDKILTPKSNEVKKHIEKIELMNKNSFIIYLRNGDLIEFVKLK